MAEEDEVLVEVEAVQSVYGDDCLVIDQFPPHLQVHVKPRTADVSSEQYPGEPPQIDLIECKGLDEQRQKHLRVSIEDRARQLSSCLMLVALCEEAVEMLSVMNHPDGDCPLCLYPMVPKDKEEKVLPFMKLMSCFHCFHSECIIRWWNWLQKEKESDGNMGDSKVMHAGPEENKGNCPVCRKTFQAKDLEHVLDLVGSHSSKLGTEGNEVDKDGKFLHSDSENIKRHKFEAILKMQEERNGIIEPQKDLVVLPCMFVSQSVPTPASASNSGTIEREPSGANSSSHRRQERGGTVASDSNSTGPSNPRSNEHRNSGTRKHPYARRQAKHWVKKDDSTAG